MIIKLLLHLPSLDKDLIPVWKIKFCKSLKSSRWFSGYISPSKNSIQKFTKSMLPEHSLLPNRSKNNYTTTKISKKPNISSKSSSFIENAKRRKIIPKNTEGNALHEMWYLLDNWLTKISHLNDSSYKLKINKLTTKITDNPFAHAIKPLQLQRNHVTFFQLWSKIRDRDKNFTLGSSIGYNLHALNSTNRRYNGSYDHRNEYITSKTKGIIVEDARYTTIMEKWITNRHARDFSSRENVSDQSNSMNLTIGSNESQSACGSCLNESTMPRENISLIEKHNLTCNENYTLANASKLKIFCNTTAANFSKAGKSADNPESKVYDPLMPYPEEYPEEYQTIQNGPALIISRTTYTRIPNVTYTTITMVTLPTYRLVEKAEDGFAATLFDEKRRSARCNNECSSWTMQQQLADKAWFIVFVAWNRPAFKCWLA